MGVRGMPEDFLIRRKQLTGGRFSTEGRQIFPEESLDACQAEVGQARTVVEQHVDTLE
jgi:hypothetical protein